MKVFEIRWSPQHQRTFPFKSSLDEHLSVNVLDVCAS